MIRQTMLITLWLGSFIALGQASDTTYFNLKGEKCRKESAVTYRMVFPGDSGTWIATKYYMSGRLKMFGTYLDKKLKKQQGPAIFYYFNGKVMSRGQYLNNQEVGLWKTYYSNGNLSSMGKMVNGKNDSIWTYYNMDGSLFGSENYINGKMEGDSKWFFESGKICELTTYENNEIKSRIVYDEDGNVINNPEKDCPAEFLGGNDSMIRFLNSNLKYPEELMNKVKEGWVLFHFIVRKDGSIEKVQYEKTDHELFNKEAERVFTMIRSMKPARSHGRLIDQECTFPIHFILEP